MPLCDELLGTACSISFGVKALVIKMEIARLAPLQSETSIWNIVLELRSPEMGS